MAKIEYVKWGMANRFGDRIEMHQALREKRYKPLHDWILRHELSHSDGLTKEDVMMDIRDTYMKPTGVSKLYFKFFFTHPTAWTHSFPMWYSRKYDTMYFDIVKIWQWLAMIAFVGGMIWLFS